MYLLLETGGRLLLETGGAVLLDVAPPPSPPVFLGESHLGEYRFILEDVISGLIVADDVDLAPGVTYEDTLNRAGGIKATLSMDSPYATEELLSEGRTALYVMRNDRIEQGGIIWDITPSSDGTLDLVADGWLGYFDHQVIETDRVFDGVEQFTIVETLVDDLQDEAEHGAGYDLGISVAWDAPSGVLRDRLEDYRPWRTKNLGEAVRQLAATVDGFDIAMRYELAGDRIVKTMRLYYPSKGRDTGHVFELDALGGNITNYALPRSARTMAWAGRGWGDGADEARLS
ncbi:MAG: hypothetical protein LC798_05550, partial [Chloroflexi bacterium]|nr:hypothetical protein [Chloroflexota bacterium]